MARPCVQAADLGNFSQDRSGSAHLAGCGKLDTVYLSDLGVQGVHKVDENPDLEENAGRRFEVKQPPIE